jgi:lysophospholipase L1-like esterase
MSVWFGRLLVAGQCALAVSLAWQWLCVSTHRLYLDERRAPVSAPVGARQRFDVLGGRVKPQIVSTENERLSFPLDFRRPSELDLRVVPRRQASFEIAIVEGGSRRILQRGTLTEAADIAQPLPATNGVLELANEGPLLWSDPRVVQGADVGPTLFALVVLIIAGLQAGRLVPLAFPQTAWARTALLGGLTACITTALCLAFLEIGLRTIGDRLPSWITDPRRNLGEVHADTDPRWQDSASYGHRLAPRVDTFCQWREGDIVRMGFLPSGLARHPVYRFPFVTDADGFRNSESVPTTAVVAALGDSFTDGLTLPAGLTWPARLADHLGDSVRNYGTAGFGPGQELLVLKQYVRARRPRRVVIGFFAGNDLVDAERFESFQREGVDFPSVGRGWKFKGEIARFDELYVTSLYQGASGLLGNFRRQPAEHWAHARSEDYSGDDPAPSSATRPGFQRGLFTVPVAGRVLRFAFLPPYLNRLTLSRQQLEASRGWQLTRRSYREMQQLLRAQGSELVVLFIPFKAQVYLPLLEASFPAAELGSALRSSLGNPQAPGLEVLMQNRLALNDLMREFCAEEGIAFLDLTAELQSTLRTGRNVYFPDDSHWNAAGHEAAARALSRLLRAQGLGARQARGRDQLGGWGRQAGDPGRLQSTSWTRSFRTSGWHSGSSFAAPASLPSRSRRSLSESEPTPPSSR